MTIVGWARPVVGGVDTHLDVHVAAVVDAAGGLLGVKSFPTTSAGYRALSSWMSEFGVLERVGIEGTGAYGAGLSRHFGALGVSVIEVDRPNRQARHRNGKADHLDAIEAARGASRAAARCTPRPAPDMPKRCASCWWRSGLPPRRGSKRSCSCAT